jgi:hypothetical protein
MTTQRTLWGSEDPFVPHVAGSETSKQAADRVRSKVERDKDQIEAWLKVFGPATDQMIQDALGMDGSSERPRRIDLVNELRVVDSGLKMLTRSESWAVAWTVRK